MRNNHLMRSVLMIAGLTGALAGCSADPEAAPSTSAAAQNVGVTTVAFANAYTQVLSLTGQVEANRHSDLGFELPGQLAAVLADEGDAVDAGQPLARLATERLRARRAEAAAMWQQARTAASLAAATFARIEEARGFDGVSVQEFDEASNARDTARAAADAARARMQSIDVDIEKSTLIAPFDSVITRRHADEGQVLAPGQSVLSLQERGELTVRVGVAGAALERLTPGTAHSLTINGQAVDATVRQQLPQRDRVARTVDVLLAINPPPSSVRAGDLARLSVTETQQKRGVWLPLDALTEGSRGLWTVYVAAAANNNELGATHRVAPRPVNVVFQDGHRAYVDGALQDGDRVIVAGLKRIVPGQYVRLSELADTP